MIRPEHLGQRISALVDGELGHAARDRALSHIAHCATCHAVLEQERRVKDRISTAPAPPASAELTARLRALAEPGDPVPPRDRRMPLAPLVPTLPPPGRSRTGGPLGRLDSRRPGSRGHASRGRGASARRPRYAAASAVSALALMIGTAFMVGGAPAQPGAPVLPPTAELSVEHAATTAGLPLSDPAFGAVTASFGGLTFPRVATAPGR